MRCPRLLALVCLWAAAGLDQASGAQEMVYPPADVVEVVTRLNGQRLSAECRASIRPMATVIVAGMSAEGIKPAGVQEQLDRQLAAVEELVKGHQGTLRRLERLRAVRSPAEQVQKAPFVALQRLEIELPVAAPLDAILDKLLLLGVDRFGSEIRLDEADRGAKLVALYRFDRLEEQLQDIQDGCRREAFRLWCEQARSPATSRADCPDLLELLKGYFHDEALRLDGLRVLDTDGRVRSQGITWPASGMRWGDVRVGSPDPVELSGQFMTAFDLRPR